MKKFLKLFIPPIISKIYSWLRLRGRGKIFSGIYSRSDEVCDQNPWIQSFWINDSQAKLVSTRSYGNKTDLPFMPKHQLGYLEYPAVLINLLSSRAPVHVLDLGGGTGFSFFKMWPYLSSPKNVFYHVQDSNLELFALGRWNSEYMGLSNSINFHYLEIPTDHRFDILYVNTSMQYIYNWRKMLAELLRHEFKYLVFTRMLAGNMKEFITCQTIGGFSTQCMFINFSEFKDFLHSKDYHLISKSSCEEDELSDCYDNNIGNEFRIPHSVNLIFERM